MITISYQKSTRLLIMGLAGLFVAISGILIYTFNPVQMIIVKMIQMKPNSVTYNIWSNPGYEVFIKCYIFNITNEKQFLEGNEKLKVEEVGPYVYQETLLNMNGTFNPNGTLTFTQRRYLEFKRDESVGDPDTDHVNVPNIPLLGILTMYKNNSLIKFAVNTFGIWYQYKYKSILQLNVTEYLFGYTDALVTNANRWISGWIDFEQFGILDRLMALDNATNIITIRTRDPVSNDDLSTYPYDNMPYSITRYNGNPGLPLWGYIDENNTEHKENIRCNTIKGSFVEGLFPTDLNENSTIRLYRRAFCRPVDFRLVNQETIDGIELINLKMSEKFLATPKENPDNRCYCYKGVCPKKGLGYITPCYYGLPIVLSQPHYYNADPELLKHVDGLSPNEKDHDTTMSIHSKLGLPVRAQMRIQINMEADTGRTPFTGLMMPLFWLELEMRKPPPLVNFLITMLYSVLPILQQVFAWLFMLLGTAMVGATALLILHGPTNYGFEDPFNNRIGYSPVRIFPMTEYIGR